MQCRCGGCGEWGHNNTKQKCPEHRDYKTYWANVSKDEDRKQAKKATDDAQAYLKRRYVGNKIKNDLKSRVTSSRNGCVIQVMNLLMEIDIGLNPRMNLYQQWKSFQCQLSNIRASIMKV